MLINLLIVDDEPQNRELAKVILFKEGYKLLFANDGAEALHILKEQKIDLMLLDLMMPKMDGFTLLREMKKFQEAKPKIIVLTASGDENNMQHALKLGANGYLQKPYDIVDLKQRIRHALEEKQEENLDYKDIINDFIAGLDTKFSSTLWREITIKYLQESNLTLREDLNFLSITLTQIMDKNYRFDANQLTISQVRLHHLLLEKLASQKQLSLNTLLKYASGRFIP